MIAVWRVRVRFAVLAAVVCVLLSAAAAGQARAADFTVRPCADSVNRWDGPPTFPESSSMWTFNYECPNWIWIGAIAPVSGSAEWRYPSGLDGSRQIKTFTASIMGDPYAGDIHYSFKVCTNGLGECDGPTLPAVQKYEWDPTFNVSFNAADYPHPLGRTYTSIRIEARCDKPEGETCEPQQLLECEQYEGEPPCMPYPEIGLYGMSIKLADTIKPTLARSPNGQTDPLHDSEWISSTRNIRLQATDSGSGIVYLQLSKGSHNWQVTNGCGFALTSTFSLFCPSAWEPVIAVDPTKPPWTQGINTLYARAHDMGKNQSDQFSISFLVDTVPPGAPPGLRVAGHPDADGWISETESTIEWDSLTGQMSPLTEAQLSLDLKNDPSDEPVVIHLNGESLPTSHTVRWPGSGIWNVAVRFKDEAGNLGDWSQIEVPVDMTRPDRLLPALPRWIGAPALAEGQPVTWLPPANADALASGVCAYRMGVDSDAVFAGGDAATIDPPTTAADLPAGLTEGDWFLHLWAVSCAGTSGQPADVEFGVDLTAPQAESDLGERYWLDPAEKLTLHATDAGGSGVGRIEYVDNGDATSVLSDWAEPDLVEGRHQMQYRAIDMAGNSSPSHQVSFGVDHSGPTGWIEPVDPENPRRIAAVVEDSLSGVQSAELQFRSRESGEWKRFGEPVVADGEPPGSAAISASFPDTSVPDGAYDVRVVAVDRIGNSTAIDLMSDGSAAGIVTPVRVQPVIHFGVKRKPSCKRAARGLRCRVPQLVNHYVTRPGKGARVSGTITMPDGRPLAGRDIEIVATDEYLGEERRETVVRSAADGSFTAVVGRGMNRIVNARYRGSGMFKPASAKKRLSLLSPARLTLRVSDRTPTAGTAVAFSGKILLGGAKLTALGQAMEIQYQSGRSWRTLMPATALPDGRYKIDYPVIPVDRPLRLTIRAFVKRAPLFPYANGASRSVSIVIQPRAAARRQANGR